MVSLRMSAYVFTGGIFIFRTINRQISNMLIQKIDKIVTICEESAGNVKNWIENGLEYMVKY